MLLENIKAQCKEKGISISKLERECGLSSGNIGRWDKISPSVDNARRVAAYLGTTVDALISNSGKKITVKSWRNIKGIVLIEDGAALNSVGFTNLKQFVNILDEFGITESDHIAVQIQRGDGADS